MALPNKKEGLQPHPSIKFGVSIFVQYFKIISKSFDQNHIRFSKSGLVLTDQVLFFKKKKKCRNGAPGWLSN